MNPEANPEHEPRTGNSEPGTSAIVPGTAAIVLALPPLALAFASVVLMALGALDGNPLWPRQDDVTMAEAAALRDPGTVAWMIMSGVDPNVPMVVRAGVLDERAHQLTPGEAAIHADRTEVLHTLAARGARVDAEVVHGWWCLAMAIDAEESVMYLRAKYAEWTLSPCSPRP